MRMIVRGRDGRDKNHDTTKDVSVEALRLAFILRPASGVFVRGNRDAYIGELDSVQVMDNCFLRFDIDFKGDGRAILEQWKPDVRLIPEFFIDEYSGGQITECTLDGWSLLPDGKFTEGDPIEKTDQI